MPYQIIWSWYTGRWWVGCYVWYSDEGTGRGPSPPRPLIAVPNVTAHPSTANVPITVLMYNDPLPCGFNVPIKALSVYTVSLRRTEPTTVSWPRLLPVDDICGLPTPRNCWYGDCHRRRILRNFGRMDVEQSTSSFKTVFTFGSDICAESEHFLYASATM